MRTGQQLARNLRVQVLVVEDEYFIAEEIALAAKALGCDVLGPISDLAAAVALVSSGARIDVGILDINLRGREAFELADLLTERGIPFVFATGYDASIIPDRFHEVPQWTKPFDHGELALMVTQIAAPPMA